MYEVIYLQLFCPVSLMADIGQCEFNLAGNFYIKDVLSVSLFVPVDRYLLSTLLISFILNQWHEFFISVMGKNLVDDQ